MIYLCVKFQKDPLYGVNLTFFAPWLPWQRQFLAFWPFPWQRQPFWKKSTWHNFTWHMIFLQGFIKFDQGISEKRDGQKCAESGIIRIIIKIITRNDMIWRIINGSQFQKPWWISIRKNKIYLETKFCPNRRICVFWRPFWIQNGRHIVQSIVTTRPFSLPCK